MQAFTGTIHSKPALFVGSTKTHVKSPAQLSLWSASRDVRAKLHAKLLVLVVFTDAFVLAAASGGDSRCDGPREKIILAIDDLLLEALSSLWENGKTPAFRALAPVSSILVLPSSRSAQSLTKQIDNQCQTWHLISSLSLYNAILARCDRARVHGTNALQLPQRITVPWMAMAPKGFTLFLYS